MIDRTAVERGMAIATYAADDPDRAAIVSEFGNRTYAELNDRSNRLVRALRRRGLVAGDAVGLLARNRPEFAEVYAACLRAGWRLTPVNFHLTGPEAGYILDDCDAKAFVADAGFAEAAGDAVTHAPADTARLAIGGDIGGFEPYDGALAAEDGDDIDDPTLGSTMLYTSGTTGRPKGVVRGDRGQRSRAPSRRCWGTAPATCTCAPVPSTTPHRWPTAWPFRSPPARPSS